MNWADGVFARCGAVPVVYGNIRIDTGFRADLVVEDNVIVEIKSVESLAPIHKKQLLTYLRLADKRLGLRINFHVPLIKDGITRIVNRLEADAHAKSPSRQDAKTPRRQDAKTPRRVGHPLLGISRAQPLAMLSRCSVLLRLRMEAADPRRLANDVAVHRLQQVLSRRVRWKVQLRIQRIELEHVVVQGP